MRTDLFDYELPQELIAQQPLEPRDGSRLLVLNRADGGIVHGRFSEIGDYLRAGDLLIGNDSRVIPARLHGRKLTGGHVEILLLRRLDDDGCRWECLTRGRKIVEGVRIGIGSDAGTSNGAADGGQSPDLTTPHPLHATVEQVRPTGTRMLRFSAPVRPHLDELGEIPLPPYITDYHGDRERYQTIYSQPEGSAAAPTAGLHFTPDLLIGLRRQGVQFDTVTLHVGLDTFRPVESEELEDHVIHSEWAELGTDTAKRINDVTLQGGRIAAVGTTTVRTLEWAASRGRGSIRTIRLRVPGSVLPVFPAVSISSSDPAIGFVLWTCC